MKLNKLLEQIDENQKTIANYGTFDEAILKKINYKIRLDWNYYSNRMEGGTLTKAETRSVMVGNLEVAGKPFKDVAEMNGHDKAVIEVLKMSKGELRISEKRIRELHKTIMHEDEPEKAAQIGIWKREPNEIINYKNEKIEFTSPENVANEVHEILNKTNAELDLFYKNKSKKHALELAAQFHIDFVSIHPFYDGNGRMSRILTNILLMSCGLPAIVIKDEHKQAYYRLLADIQAYGGKEDLFYEFLAQRVLETQKLVLDALEGKEIDEPEDLDKKLALLERELNAIDTGDELQKQFSQEVFFEMFEDWVKKLIQQTIPEIQKFNRLFSGTGHSLSIENSGFTTQFIDENADGVVSNFLNELNRHNKFVHFHNAVFRISTHYGALIKGGLKTFGCNYFIEIRFESIKYEVYVDDFNEESDKRKQSKLFEKLLHKPLSDKEIHTVVKHLTDTIYEHIDVNTKKRGLR
jgi:Fic family protein